MSWRVGQEAICVRTDARPGFLPPPLVKGRIYVVRGIRTCVCGSVQLDVNLPTAKGAIFTVCMCGHRENLWPTQWCYADRFRPVDRLSDQLARIESEAVQHQELEPA